MSATPPTPGPDIHPLETDIADQLLDRLNAAGCTEASAIDVLTWAFAAAGNTVVVDCARRRGFDLCVSSSHLEAIGGDPLLVKVKRSLAPGTVDQVLRKLADRPNARLGLVVYLESLAGNQPPSGAQPGPNRFPVLAARDRFPVLVISARQLLRSMASASFAEVVSR
jgi:hypothetical protein